MGEQKGIIRLRGKVGNVSFYHQDGVDLAKTPGGATKEQIMKDPRFVRVRENMSEFGGSAMVGKAFRDSIAEVLPVMKGQYLTGRVTAKFRTICTLGTGTRGQRDIVIVANKAIIVGLNFSIVKLFSAIFSAPYSLVANAGRNETTLTIPDFNTSNYINPPEGATHCRFVNAASILSDYKFNTTIKVYEPLNPTINGLNIVAYSAYIPLGGMVGGVTTVVSTIAGSPTMVSSAGLIGCIGIEFYQVVNSSYYLLNAENAMRIEDVF